MKHTDTTIDYEGLVQSAIRKVMCNVLRDIAKNGLPGKHHFYIDFITHYPGVEIPAYLREDYPDDMTIVIQYEYWDLSVDDKKFSITLTFDDAEERLTIPFDAITKFVDPSVNFGLEFTPDLTGYDDLDLSAVFEAEQGVPKKEPLKPLAEGESNVVTLDAFRKK